MTNNEIKKTYEAEFGKCPFQGFKDGKVARSKDWPIDPNHPANAPDSEYVKPCMDYLIGKKNDTKPS
jgi:hypothetical protein